MLIEEDEHEMAAFTPDWGGRRERGKEGKERGRERKRGTKKERKERGERRGERERKMG